MMMVLTIATAVRGPTALLPRVTAAGCALGANYPMRVRVAVARSSLSRRYFGSVVRQSYRRLVSVSVSTRYRTTTALSSSLDAWSRMPQMAATMSTSSSSSITPSQPLLPRLPIFEALLDHANGPDGETSTAVVHSLSGRSFSYADLPADVCAARDQLLQSAAHASDGARETQLTGQRIAFLVENSYDYVVTFLAILAINAIAVPLSPAFPISELQYISDHSGVSLLVASPRFFAKAQELVEAGLQSKPTLVRLEKHFGNQAADGTPRQRCALKADDPNDHLDAGMMLYTSGTTSRPKGVLLSQFALTAQCKSLIEAWKYSRHDLLLHVLPLHHIHGTVNGVFAPLFAGSTVEFMFPFNADAVWKRFAEPFQSSSATQKPPVTVFTAVPTVYSRLLTASKSLPEAILAPAREAISPVNMRLAMSGSAALPAPTKQAWRDLGHGAVLLERYGMTEVGMALSCGLAASDRVDGSVGWPLPDVEVRLVDVDSGEVIPPGDGDVDASGKERVGEIQVRGPTVFSKYWNNLDATAKEFIEPPSGFSWFKTGDVAVRRSVTGAGLDESSPWARGPMYFIQGRISADIIKTGGEKVSALEVERELLSLPEVSEAAVAAVPSGKWGQKVGAVVVLDSQVASSWTPLAMRRALRDRLANYKIPQVLRVVDSIPRNAMGKINKKELVKSVFAQDASGDEQ